jgi:signal transduction histidine kinase
MNSEMTDTAVQLDSSTRELEKLRIKILFEQSWVAQFGSLIVAALYVYLVWHKASLNFLEVWTTSLLVLMIARFILVGRFSHYHLKLGRDFNPKKWENIFTLFTFCSGVTWCLALCAAFPVGDLPADALMAYILAGITAGAAVAYNTSLKSTYAFFIPSVIPFALRLALKGDEAYWVMSLMLFAYSVSFLKLTHKFNQYAIKSITLSFQKDQLIERIRLMQSQVTQSAQMAAMGRMAGGMAHEINNPLAIITASSDLIQIIVDRKDTGKLLQDTSSLLKKITEASERISKIIKELRFFSGKPSTDQYLPTPVTKVLDSAMNFCNERFKAYDVKVKMGSIPEQLTIECQQFQITQVVLNLLYNSFDSVWEKDERWISIEVLDLGERIEMGITDSGKGIPEEIRSKLMQPFFSTKEVGKGMGLGLSIANGIVLNHQGKLWLDVGSLNTRFVISLPKVRKIDSRVAA